MKRKIILISLILNSLYFYGQDCGIYRVKYIGYIKSDSVRIEKIKLPTVEFLQGLRNENPEDGFVEIIPKTNRIELELHSNITSNLYDKSESLLNSYKSQMKSIPLFIVIKENDSIKELRIEINWNDIQITKLEDEKFGNLFMLNLKIIKL